MGGPRPLNGKVPGVEKELWDAQEQTTVGTTLTDGALTKCSVTADGVTVSERHRTSARAQTT